MKSEEAKQSTARLKLYVTFYKQKIIGIEEKICKLRFEQQERQVILQQLFQEQGGCKTVVELFESVGVEYDRYIKYCEADADFNHFELDLLNQVDNLKREIKVLQEN